VDLHEGLFEAIVVLSVFPFLGDLTRGCVRVECLFSGRVLRLDRTTERVAEKEGRAIIATQRSLEEQAAARRWRPSAQARGAVRMVDFLRDIPECIAQYFRIRRFLSSSGVLTLESAPCCFGLVEAIPMTLRGHHRMCRSRPRWVA